MAAAVLRLYNGQTPPPSLWTFDDLVDDFQFANRLEMRAGDAEISGVLESTAMLVEIIREEKYLRRRMEDEERRKKLDDK